MSKEVWQSIYGKELIRRTGGILPKTASAVVLAGSIFALTAMSNDSVNASSIEFQNDYFPSPITIVTKEALTNPSNIISPISIAESNQEQEETKSKNETISDFLKNNYARSGIAALLGMALAMTATAHYLGKRHDEFKLYALRIAGPIAMAASVSTALVDSFTTIDRNIPASLFLTSTLLIASHQIISAFEHYKNPKIRASATFTAAMLTSLGVTTLVALNR